MDTKNVVPEENSDTKFLEKLKGAGFQPKAFQILEAARSRGRITTEEIAATLPVGAIRDRELFSSLVTEIGEYLQISHIEIVSGAKEQVHKKEHPLIRTPKLALVSSQKEPVLITKNRPKRRAQESGLLPSTEPDCYESLSETEKSAAESQYVIDILSQYYKEVGKLRLLTAAEEIELTRRIQEENDLDARNTLVSHNLRFVVWTAKRFIWSGLPLEDLIQEGNIGLITAAEKFDYRKGYRFTTYAGWWVRQSIGRSIQYEGLIRLPAYIQELRRKILSAVEEIADETNDLPSEEAIAVKLKLSVSTVKKSLHAMKMDIIPLDEGINSPENGGGPVLLEEALADPNAVNPIITLEATQELLSTCSTISNAFEIMRSKPGYSERNMRIFKTLYGLDSTWEEKTLEEAGKEFGISRERVRQIVAKIWKGLTEAGMDFDYEKLRQHLWRIGELEKLANAAVRFEE